MLVTKNAALSAANDLGLNPALAPSQILDQQTEEERKRKLMKGSAGTPSMAPSMAAASLFGGAFNG